MTSPHVVEASSCCYQLAEATWLLLCCAGYPAQAPPGPKTADQPPAWAYAAAAPTWDAPPQSTPALGNTADPMHNAPAFYGSGPPEFSGQTIYNVNQVGPLCVSDMCMN